MFMTGPKTAKAHAREVIDRLRDDASWDEIMCELFVRESIDVGLTNAAAGRTTPREGDEARLQELSRRAALVSKGRTPTPDRAYRIDADERPRLQSGVDADALERLLQYFPAESRASHLEMFSVRRIVDDPHGRPPDITTLTRISEPIMQNLLEEVWQPYWSSLSDAELAQALGGPPGLELARRRRADERRG